ncbi:MAG: DMT family transporter [Clostridium sp.]|nr:DMT family transporter [Clostridium sp.]
MKNTRILGHILALVTMFIWGITYISTKVLLEDFTPLEILLYRFIIAYIILLIIHPKFKKIVLKDEILFALAGLTGLTIYYAFENISLNYTLASNVGLLITTAPILTAIFNKFAFKEKSVDKKLIYGFVLAIIGIFLVVFNGNFILKLNPLGDFLAIIAAVVWAVYSIILAKIGDKYNYIYVTRKMFFYGIITLLPLILISDVQFSFESIFIPKNFWNLAFLSVIASSLCFVIWNKCMRILGPVTANNYIYMVPLITATTSVIVLDEPLTKVVIIGGVLILVGLYISQNGFKNPFNNR